jgi:DNA-binding NarL/FixJ family response regulator
MKIKILLVDDHPIVRDGLTLRIQRQPDLVVCGEADSCAKALAQVAACRPDLIVADLVLKDGSGLDLIRDLKIRSPQLPVLVLSMQDEKVYALRAIRAGARGYLMKQEAADKVIEALRRILAGHVYLSPQMTAQLVDCQVGGDATVPGTADESLSDRELEVFSLLGQGLRTRQIAARLHLSVKTIESYYERIKTRLQLDAYPELLREAVLWVHAKGEAETITDDR